jgi:hypothetical protein
MLARRLGHYGPERPGSPTLVCCGLVSGAMVEDAIPQLGWPITAGVMEGKFVLIQYEDGRPIGGAYEVTGRGRRARQRV